MKIITKQFKQVRTLDCIDHVGKINHIEYIDK